MTGREEVRQAYLQNNAYFLDFIKCLYEFCFFIFIDINKTFCKFGKNITKVGQGETFSPVCQASFAWRNFFLLHSF